MKMLRIKTLLIIICLISIVLPEIVIADAVPWTSENYSVYAQIESDYDTYTLDSALKFPPENVIEANASFDLNYGSSNYSGVSQSGIGVNNSSGDSSIYFSTGTGISSQPLIPDILHYDFNSSATSTFTGIYTATSTTLNITYRNGLAFFSSDSRIILDSGYTWLSVYDATDSIYLYNNSRNFTDYVWEDYQSISTPMNHEIIIDSGVNSEFNVSCSSDISCRLPFGSGNNYDASIIMEVTGTPIVPEPVSSILFITGGATLIGRRYLSRKK